MDDAVVISGVGGHFPECDNLKEYGEKLLQNLHLISDAAGELQPKYTPEVAAVFRPDLQATISKENLKSGKMRFGDKFDNTFFGMHARLAAATDAITRHVLESTMEAVVDAGYSPKDLHGSNTAVFMGYHSSESESNFIRESADGFGIMGLNAAMTANRVSYWLDLKGTSFTHNTQLVSGMQGLDMAFRALSRGECDRALVGAASLSYLAELATHYDDLGWLSPSGTCKPFDAGADGGIRSEAVVVMLLERRNTANRVYAEVVHTAASLCAEMSRSELPSVERRVMSHLLHSFYTECRVDPNQITYLEADGWGVWNIDEAEIGSLDDAIASRRSKPLRIGSVKGNIGQVEAASGLASICKVLVAMESGTIPATVNHVQPPARLAAIKSGRMQVVTENQPLGDGLVAVNNLGLGGLVGHVLLRPNAKTKTYPILPAIKPAPTETTIDTPFPTLLLMSGRTPEGLDEVINKAEACAADPEFVHLVHGAFSSHIFGHMYRGYTVVPKGEQQPNQVKFYTGQKRPIWFIYSGMGSQWPGMAEDLLRIPVFAAAIDRCHKALVPLGLDLKHIITTRDADIYDNILHSFVGIAAVQVGLTDVLRAVGIEPTGIIGHSVGELGCAYADGCITAEQMILAAHARGQASNETQLIPGMMAAVGMGYKDIKDMIPEDIEVACHNSNASCTLSGPTASMNAFVAKLKEQGVFARAVNVSNIAYHSRYIRPAAPRLLELLKDVITEPKPRSPRWISTSVKPGEHKNPEAKMASAEYFTGNLLSSVYFEEGCENIEKDALAIEIAPHGLLQAILKRSLDQDAVNIAMTKRDMPGTAMVLDALGKMYMEGLNPRVANLYPKVQTPVSRGTAPLAPLATWDHRDSWPVAFLKAPAESGPRTELHLPLALSTIEFAHLVDCTWNGHPVLTPATCLNLVLTAVESYAEKGLPIILENIVFYDPLVVPEEGADEVYVFVQRGSGRFEVSAEDRLVASGVVNVILEADKDKAVDKTPPVVPREDRVPYDADYVYEELGRRGLQCSGQFRSLEQLQQGAKVVLGSVAHCTDRLVHLDTLMQVVMLQRSEGSHELHQPRRIQKIVIDSENVLSEGSKPVLHYDLARRAITLSTSTGRLDVALVHTRGVSLPPKFAPILVQSRTFLPFNAKDGIQDLVHLASVSIQLAASQSRIPVFVTTVTSPNTANATRSPLLDAVHSAADKQLPDLHVRVSSDSSGDGAALLVSDASSLPTALAAVRRQRGLLLAEIPAGFKSPEELHELLSFEQGQGRARYVLLKHTVDVDPSSEVIQVEDGANVPLERLSLCQGAVVYLVFRGVPVQHVPGVLRTVHAASGGNRAHCLFLQESSLPLSVQAPPYAAQLRLGLRVNVLQGGRWGGVYRLHLANVDAGSVGCERLGYTRQLVMDDMQLQFLGVNPYSDVAEDGRALGSLGLLDYAARRSDGQRVMGVCASSAGPLQPDPILAWPVPQGWSDEDAGTVPLAYATALYVLHEQLGVRAGEHALVVGGNTALGQAAITLLLVMGCNVVTTVKDERERADLQTRLPHPNLVVLVGRADEICRALRKMSGKSECVDIVLCQGGPENLRSVTQVMKKYGRTAHVGADHSVLSHRIGMSAFLLSTALYSVAWNWPVTVRDDAKTRVRDAMFTAIQQGAVRPLPRYTAPAQALAESQRRVVEGAGKVVLSMKQGDSTSPPSYLDPGRSCLVLGGSAARAVSISEWLLSSGARVVSVSLGGRAAGSTWLARRLALLAAHYGATVRALPPGDLPQLVKAASQPCPLGLVMVLEQLPARVRALDACTRLHACTLAVLAAHGSQQQELDELSDAVRCRREQGFPAVLASLADLSADVRVMPLQEVLRTAMNPSVHCVDVLQIVPSDDLATSDGGSAALSGLLPKSVEALRRLGLSLTDGVSQRVLPSLIGGSFERRDKEVPPVFMVSGLSDSASRELGPIAHYLMATAVVVTPPASAPSIQDAANAVAASIVRAKPYGPYTLVGRGWGGCVALEAARVISTTQGCYATVFLLDSAPDALDAAFRPLHNQPSGLPTALLKYLLQFDRETEELVYRAPDWSAQVQRALGRRDELLEEALTCVLRRVKSLIDYRPAEMGPLPHKVAVSLVSNRSYHLTSTVLNEVCQEVRSEPLGMADDDSEQLHKQCATTISAGVHVGRTHMQERGALASLTVSF